MTDRTGKTLAAVALASSLGINSCKECKVEYLTGEVIKEEYHPYVLQINTAKGVYTASILGGDSLESSVARLSIIIDDGSKIRFPINRECKQLFDIDKSGFLHTSDITVLNKDTK